MKDFFSRELQGYGIETSYRDLSTKSFDDLQKMLLNIEKRGPHAIELPEDLRDQMINSDLLIVHYCPVPSSVINKSVRLRFIGCLRGGYENIDVNSAKNRGIIVVNAPGRSSNAVAEFTIGLMIAEGRNIARGHHFLHKGEWRKYYLNDPYRSELKDQIIGIIGFGKIGSNVAEKLQAFGVKRILVFDPLIPNNIILNKGCEPADLETLCRVSDFITIHARLTKDSEKMINKELISLMKPTAYLINTARAGLIDNAALYEALRNKTIGGAALDVFDIEPLPPDSPWLELENVTLTPHLAGDTRNTRINSMLIIKEEIEHYLRGEPLSHQI